LGRHARKAATQRVFGAKVAAYEAGFIGDANHLLGFREIEAHGGFSSQNSIDANFGLPGQALVDVRVTWPGSAGVVTVTDSVNIAVGQRITIHEADPMPVGSCCSVDGSCRVNSALECQNEDATWTEGGACVPNTCPRFADPVLAAAPPHDTRKNRYVSFDGSANASTIVAIAV
jgi:hypothetical protein